MKKIIAVALTFAIVAGTGAAMRPTLSNAGETVAMLDQGEAVPTFTTRSHNHFIHKDPLRATPVPSIRIAACDGTNCGAVCNSTCSNTTPQGRLSCGDCLNACRLAHPGC
jgi:hypothetical protein